MSIKLMLPRPLNRLSLPLAILFLFIAFQSCSPKIPFATSTVVPSAQGSVKVTRDNNKNYSIDIDIKHLADPKRLVPSKAVYVVWAETRDQGSRNIGQLKTSSSMLSSTLKSSLKTVTPYKPTMIFITAENEAGIEYPGSQVVLTTRNF